MIEKTLNFDKNYNGKLWLDYFTTIRSLETVKEKDLHEDDYVEIQKDHVGMFEAQIVSIEEIDLHELSESQKTLLMLDCGCIWTHAAYLIARMCNSHKVAVITLLKH